MDMKKYADVLHYLPERKVDRWYLNAFEDPKTLLTHNKEESVLIDCDKYHEKAFKLDNADSIIFKLGNTRLDIFDSVGIILKSSVELDLSKLKLFFSESKYGDIPLRYATLDGNATIKVLNNVYSLRFQLIDNDEDITPFLTNINSMLLELGVTADITLLNVMARYTQFETTLESIDTELKNVKQDIIHYVEQADFSNDDKVKVAQNRLAAAKLWLIKKNDDLSPEDGDFGKKNYYELLQSEVAKLIDNNLETDTESSKYINQNIVGSI